MLIFRLILLFWVSTRIGLHVLELKKHTSCLKRSSAAGLCSLCLKPSVLAPVSLKSPLLNTQSALFCQLSHA